MLNLLLLAYACVSGWYACAIFSGARDAPGTARGLPEIRPRFVVDVVREGLHLHEAPAAAFWSEKKQSGRWMSPHRVLAQASQDWRVRCSDEDLWVATRGRLGRFSCLCGLRWTAVCTYRVMMCPRCNHQSAGACCVWLPHQASLGKKKPEEILNLEEMRLMALVVFVTIWILA